MSRRRSSSRGQSLIEFTLLMPVLIVLALGVVEFGWVLLDEHVATKLTREGSNLISRDTPLVQARIALTSMSTRPVDFSSGSKLIFSVIRKGATVGSPNYDHSIIYQRYEYGDGSLPSSKLAMEGTGTFPSPEYVAVNSDNNTGLRVVPTTLPPNLNLPIGGMVYITEVYTRHTVLTPLHRFGITVPDTLYSIAYF